MLKVSALQRLVTAWSPLLTPQPTDAHAVLSLPFVSIAPLAINAAAASQQSSTFDPMMDLFRGANGTFTDPTVTNNHGAFLGPTGGGKTVALVRMVTLLC